MSDESTENINGADGNIFTRESFEDIDNDGVDADTNGMYEHRPDTFLSPGNDDELVNVPTPNGLPVSLTHPASGRKNSLEMRINRVVRCVVCDLVPFSRIYQCQHGHLFCGGCYQTCMVGKMNGEEIGNCAKCRIILPSEPTRNLVAERTIAEMAVKCVQCGVHTTRGLVGDHTLYTCEQRLVACKYQIIGCKWRGILPTAEAHQEQCEWRQKKGADLLPLMRVKHAAHNEQVRVLQNSWSLFQLPRIAFHLLHVLPHRNGTFPRNQFVSVRDFSAINHKWTLLLRWHVPEERGSDLAQLPSNIAFKLRLNRMNAWNSTLAVSYIVVRGSYSDISFEPNMQKFEFSRANVLGPAVVLYRNTFQHCNEVLHGRGLYARLVMAHS